MAQHDYDISNATFPAVRSDINSVLEAINTSNSGTSRPSSAVAGTIWLDTTSATTPTLKFYDGSDDISLATLDYTANTVNWLDSTVVFDIVGDTTPQLGGDLDVNGNSLVTTSNGDITFTPDGTGKVVISGLNYPTADGTADQVLKTDGSGNLSFTDIDTGISWQSVQSTAFTAVVGNGYPCNTTSSAFTVTLPASPSYGDEIAFIDYSGTFSTNNLTLDNNGNKINGLSASVKLETDREATKIVYTDSTQGWIAFSGVNEGSSPSLTTPSYSIDFLVVAGGASGAGGNFIGGGGGAGGFRTSTQTVFSGSTITVTVGDGGASQSNGAGNNGSDSSISGTGLTTITSTGGGGGGKFSGVSAKDGGSGGGGSAGVGAGLGNTPSTSPSQGNNGGGATTGTANAGSGGGGASAVGATANNTTGGNGGNGSSSSITGSSVTYAGGGGGSCYISGTIGTGGSGGGGNGARPSPVINATSGTANTGGGGGAGERSPVQSSGAGGKGVVIMSILTSDYSGTTTGSPTVSTSGSNTILQFNGSGSYTT